MACVQENPSMVWPFALLAGYCFVVAAGRLHSQYLDEEDRRACGGLSKPAQASFRTEPVMPGRFGPLPVEGLEARTILKLCLEVFRQSH
jgi:hypothetical protein